MATQLDTDTSTRERILRATFVVLCRHGYRKFNLSDVAAQAGISRPTLYKTFSSKDDVLAAFSQFELQLLQENLQRAIEGRSGRARVNALLAFVVDFHRSYQMRGLVELEPGLVLEQMTRALPVLNGLIAPVLEDQVADPEAVAMAIVRLALCHYLVPGYDESRLLDQLRAATGQG
jgi:TetR/AcrR family transcriptional regulator, repressor for uid operon